MGVAVEKRENAFVREGNEGEKLKRVVRRREKASNLGKVICGSVTPASGVVFRCRLPGARWRRCAKCNQAGTSVTMANATMGFAGSYSVKRFTIACLNYSERNDGKNIKLGTWQAKGAVVLWQHTSRPLRNHDVNGSHVGALRYLPLRRNAESHQTPCLRPAARSSFERLVAVAFHRHQHILHV